MSAVVGAHVGKDALRLARPLRSAKDGTTGSDKDARLWRNGAGGHDWSWS
jgi:hypothetical protein